MSRSHGDAPAVPSLLSMCICAFSTTKPPAWMSTAPAVALCTMADTGVESVTEEVAAWWWWLNKRREMSVEPILRHAGALHALVSEVKYEFDCGLHLIGAGGLQGAFFRTARNRFEDTRRKIDELFHGRVAPERVRSALRSVFSVLVDPNSRPPMEDWSPRAFRHERKRMLRAQWQW